MTEDRRQMTEGGRRRSLNRRPPSSVLRPLPSVILFGLLLGILALRATYTESPIAQMDGQMGDAVYSLTLSGLLIFAPLAWLLVQMASGRLRYRATGIEIGLVVFLVSCAISTAAASDKRLALTQVMILLGPILAAMLLAQLLDSSVRVRLLLIVIGALAVVSAYRCLEQLTTNEWTIEAYEEDPQGFLRDNSISLTPGSLEHFLWEHRLYSRGISGYFVTSNSAASFALMASFAAIALLLEQSRAGGKEGRRSSRLLWRALATVFIIAGLLLTRSKGGILAFLLAGIVLAALLRAGHWLATQRRLVWSVLLPLVLVLAVGIGYFVITYGLEHGRLPGGNSMLVRWQYWAASAQMLRDHPLVGVGPGNFAQYYTHYKPAAAPETVADPHNFPLSLLAQFGPLGLLGFILMVLGPVVKAIRLRAARDEPVADHPGFDAKRAALALLMALCAVFLLLRPILIPMPAGGDAVVVVYQIVALYLTPAAAFVIGFLLLAAPLLRTPSKRPDERTLLVPMALGCAVFGVLVHNLIDFALFEPGVWMTFWFLIAGLVAARQAQGTGRTFERSVASRSRLIATALALVAIVAYWHGAWSPAYAVTTRMQQARQAAMAGRFESAHRLLAGATEADPLNPAPLSLDGQIYVQEYDAGGSNQPSLLDEAARRFHRAIDIDPAGYKGYEKLGSVYMDLGAYAEARDAYTQAIARYPGSGRLRLERAQANERLGLRNEALEDYRKAVEIEDAFRGQFAQMYPRHEQTVSRIGQDKYRLAQERIEALSE